MAMHPLHAVRGREPIPSQLEKSEAGPAPEEDAGAYIIALQIEARTATKGGL